MTDNKTKPERHVNIPVFIPHLGCPNDCVFCNQRSISGKTTFLPEKVEEEIETALSSLAGENAENIEIAFFGGSFTGIDRELMIYLLELAEGFVKRGRVSGIRMSTRPDYISREILDILKKYTVKTIELGVQSMSDDVLSTCRRGHTAEQTKNACGLIKEYGFELVGQMMIGLPGSDSESEILTAESIVKMGASGARVYPTVVLYDTELFSMAKDGRYSPLSVEEAVKRTAAVLRVFAKEKVGVIRVGLHSDESLTKEGGIYAGAFHPALGELCENELYYSLIAERLKGVKNPVLLKLTVPKGHISKVIGNGKANRKRLFSEFGVKKIRITESDALKDYEILVETAEKY